MSNQNFWNTEIGKKFGHLIHEHNSGTGYIRTQISILKKAMEDGKIDSNPFLKNFLKNFIEKIEGGLKKQKEGVDYGYEEIKKILGYK